MKQLSVTFVIKTSKKSAFAGNNTAGIHIPGIQQSKNPVVCARTPKSVFARKKNAAASTAVETRVFVCSNVKSLCVRKKNAAAGTAVETRSFAPERQKLPCSKSAAGGTVENVFVCAQNRLEGRMYVVAVPLVAVYCFAENNGTQSCLL